MTALAVAYLGSMQGPDHLFTSCPALGRVKPWHDSGAWPVATVDLVDPEGGDICGWCVRVWRAHNVKRAVAS